VTTTATVVIVGAVGVGIFLYMRSQQQQTAAAAAGAAAVMGAGAQPTGGGIGGLSSRLWTQFKSDPLGIEQHKATLRTVSNIGQKAASGVAGVATDIIGGIKGIF
jgi:hypothetical protein